MKESAQAVQTSRGSVTRSGCKPISAACSWPCRAPAHNMNCAARFTFKGFSRHHNRRLRARLFSVFVLSLCDSSRPLTINLPRISYSDLWAEVRECKVGGGPDAPGFHVMHPLPYAVCRRLRTMRRCAALADSSHNSLRGHKAGASAVGALAIRLR
jgi:hypothetical protein